MKNKADMILIFSGMSADKGSPRGSRPPTSSTIATGRVSTDEVSVNFFQKTRA